MRFYCLSSLAFSAVSFVLLMSLPASAQQEAEEKDEEEEVDEEKDEEEEEVDEEKDEEEASEDVEQKKSSDEDAEGSKNCVAGDDDCHRKEKAKKESLLRIDESEVKPTSTSKKKIVVEGDDEETTAQDGNEPQSVADEEKTEEAAAAALVDAKESGPSLAPFTFSTSTWSRFEIRENYENIGVSSGRTQEGDQLVFRARLGMQSNPIALSDSADVLLKFSPQASGHWGQDGTIGEANLGIYEGYFKVRSKRLDVKIGRMMLNYGDALVIGNLDWNEVGRAFDGAHAHYKMDKGYVDFFVTQVAEPHPTGGEKFLSGDVYFWGAYAGIGGYAGSGSDDVDLDFYVLGHTGVGGKDLDYGDGVVVDQKGGTFVTLGTRGAGKLGPIEIKAEAGLQMGSQSSSSNDDSLSTRKTFAYHADGSLGIPIGSKTYLSAGGLVASGDNPETLGSEGWNQLFPTAHKFLGLMDVIGARTNVLSYNLKYSQGIGKSLKFKADGHLFFRLEDQGYGVGGDKGMAGMELDTQLIQKIGKYVEARVLYGLFIPKSGYYESDDLVSYGEVQAGVEF